MFQGSRGGASGRWPRNRYDPYRLNHLMLVAPEDFAQSSPHAVSRHGVADAPRGDKPGTGRARTFRQNTQEKKRTASHSPLFTHALKIGGKDQPFRFGEG